MPALTLYLRDSDSTPNKVILPAADWRWEHQMDPNSLEDIPADDTDAVFRNTRLYTSIPLGKIRDNIIVAGTFRDLDSDSNTNATGTGLDFDTDATPDALTGAQDARALRANFMAFVFNQGLGATAGSTVGTVTRNVDIGITGPIYLGLPDFYPDGSVFEVAGLVTNFNVSVVAGENNQYEYSFRFKPTTVSS